MAELNPLQQAIEDETHDVCIAHEYTRTDQHEWIHGFLAESHRSSIDSVLRRLATCTTCNGSGQCIHIIEDPPSPDGFGESEPFKCPTCDGSGDSQWVRRGIALPTTRSTVYKGDAIIIDLDWLETP